MLTSKAFLIIIDVGIAFGIILAAGASSSEYGMTKSETIYLFGLIAAVELVALFCSWILSRILDSVLARFEAYDGYSDNATL